MPGKTLSCSAQTPWFPGLDINWSRSNLWLQLKKQSCSHFAPCAEPKDESMCQVRLLVQLKAKHFSVELVFGLLGSMIQLMYPYTATESTVSAREEAESCGHGWHLFGGTSWWFSQCRTMRRIHHNFKLAAVHVLPKLPKITNLAQALYC